MELGGYPPFSPPLYDTLTNQVCNPENIAFDVRYVKYLHCGYLNFPNALISTKYLVLAVVRGQFPQVRLNLVGILMHNCVINNKYRFSFHYYTFTVHAMLSCMVVLQIIVLHRKRLGPRNTLAG